VMGILLPKGFLHLRDELVLFLLLSIFLRGAQDIVEVLLQPLSVQLRET
jgi:hypothetical protein